MLADPQAKLKQMLNEVDAALMDAPMRSDLRKQLDITRHLILTELTLAARPVYERFTPKIW